MAFAGTFIFTGKKETLRHDIQNNTPKAKSDFQDKDNLFMTLCVVLTVRDSIRSWSFKNLFILS